MSAASEKFTQWSGYLTAPFKAIYDILFKALTKPPRQFWGLLAFGVSAACLGVFLNRRWVEAKPNEWLVVIRNGKMVKAGVGLKTWANLMDTIVTFPSKVERVYFTANNGIVIEGFAFWSVFRDDDGPFRCYKYLQGCNPNESVQALCESVLRNLIANSTIDEVMKNRNHLRTHMQKQLKDQFKGWGIWLESVQITEVKISSQRLFKDLQAEFRQDTRLKAELIELQGNQKMTETKKSSEMRMFEKNEVNTTKKATTSYSEELKRKTQEQAYNTKNNTLEIQRLVRMRELQLQVTQNQKEKEVEKLKKDQAIAAKELQFKIAQQKEKIDMDKWHDETTMKKYKIDATARVYSNLYVKDLKINQFGEKSLMELLPSIGAI